MVQAQVQVNTFYCDILPLLVVLCSMPSNTGNTVEQAPEQEA